VNRPEAGRQAAPPASPPGRQCCAVATRHTSTDTLDFMIDKERLAAMGKRCKQCGRAVVAGTILCVACVAAVPRADHAQAGTHQVVITQQAPVLPDVPADRPEDRHVPEREFIVHYRGVVREAAPPAATQPAPFVPQMSRRPRPDPRQFRRVMRGSTIVPPPAAPAAPPQMPRRPRTDPRLLRHRVARSATMAVGV
jgi:hypothetical protein